MRLIVKRTLLIPLLLIAAPPVLGAGYWFSGQEVYSALQGCERVADARGSDTGAASGEQMRLARECLLVQGYVQGVADAIARNPAFALTVCTPDKATAVDLWNIVYEWLVEHPESLDGPAPVVVEQALKVAWPCAVQER